MPQAYDRFKKSLLRYHQQMAGSDAFLRVTAQELRGAERALLSTQLRGFEEAMGVSPSPVAQSAPPRLSLKKEMAPRPDPDVSKEALKVQELHWKKDAPVASSLAQHFSRELGEGEFLSSPEAQGLGDEFYVVLGIAQNIDHLALRTRNSAPVHVRFAVPENYEQIISDFSQRLDQWPGQFAQTQALLADMSAAIKDQQLVSGLKQALREQDARKKQDR